MTAAPLRYVALGDSYTIGTALDDPAGRFPDQLVAALARPGEPAPLELVANLGVNGYTTADLIRDELPALDGLEPGFVTVLIGVNDVVQSVPLATYEANVATILDALLARLPPDRIVTVAIPDYTVTPAGADYGDPRAAARRASCANNATMARLAGDRGIRVRRHLRPVAACAATDRSLVADDGLHPSGAQYAPLGRADRARSCESCSRASRARPALERQFELSRPAIASAARSQLRLRGSASHSERSIAIRMSSLQRPSW